MANACRLRSADGFKGFHDEMRGFVAAVPKVLCEAAVINFSFDLPDGGEDLLWQGLSSKLLFVNFRHLRGRQVDEYLVLGHSATLELHAWQHGFRDFSFVGPEILRARPSGWLRAWIRWTSRGRRKSPAVR